MTFMYFKDAKGVVRAVMAYIKPTKEAEKKGMVKFPYGVAVMSAIDLRSGAYRKVRGRNRAAARCQSAANLHVETGLIHYPFLPYNGNPASIRKLSRATMPTGCKPNGSPASNNVSAPNANFIRSLAVAITTLSYGATVLSAAPVGYSPLSSSASALILS